MGDWGAVALSESLQVNKSITNLNLSNNNIGPNGGQALARSLPFHKSLVQIYLNNNALQNDVIALIAESLKG